MRSDGSESSDISVPVNSNNFGDGVLTNFRNYSQAEHVGPPRILKGFRLRQICSMGDCADFLCPYENCGKILPTERTLRTHARLHRASEPVECGIGDCKQTFASSSDRSAHIQAVHEEGANVSKDVDGAIRDTLVCQVVPKEKIEKNDGDSTNARKSQECETDELRDIIQNGEYLASQLAIAKVSLWYPTYTIGLCSPKFGVSCPVC